MHFSLVMLREGIPMCIYMYLNSGFPMPMPLYYHPNLVDMIHHKPSLESLLVLIFQYMLHLIVILSYSPSVFLPTLSLSLLGIVGFCSLDQYALQALVTSNYTLLSVQ